jgi:hypothetical protein
MKKKILHIIICSFLLLGYSCENYDELIPKEYEKILSMKEVGEQNLILYTTGEDGAFEVTIMKGGKTPEIKAEAEVGVMNEDELADYSKLVGKEYKLLPSSMYEIPNPQVNFTTEERYQNRSILFKTTDIKMLLDAEPQTNYVLPVMLTSNTDSVNSEKKLLILKPNVVVPVVTYEELESSIAVSGEGVTYDFYLTLPFESLWDFEATVEVDPSSVPWDKILLPSATYTIENGGAVSFKKGSQKSEPLRITINNGDFFGSSYVIPIKITNISLPGFEFSSSVFKLYGAFNKIPLTPGMLSTNAQESSEGPIENLIDENPASYFHSAYSYPVSDAHYIQINLKEPITKCGFDYQNRNNFNGKPMEFGIMVSSDGDTWTELAHVDSDLPTTAGSKYSSPFFTATQPFSYFRYVVYKTNSGYSPTFFSLAEFTLFGK